MGTEYLTEVVQRVSDRIRQSVNMHILENPDHAHNKYAVSHMKEAEDLASAAQALAAKDAEIERLKSENKELNELFDMRWKRDREAVELWRAVAPGRELSGPDRADMVTFLLDLFTAKDACIAQLEEAVRVLGEECKDMRDRVPVGPSTNPGILSCREAVDSNPVAAKAVEP